MTIIFAGGLGFSIATFLLHRVSAACFEATAHWDTTTKHWLPGSAPLGFGLRIAAEMCRDMTKAPPWFLVSGIVAAPCVLLTWYWRDKKRRDDHRVAVEANRLAAEIGIASRYKEAAQLLASKHAVTRINGLFSLWDIARESKSHRVTVARTLASFVRVRSPLPVREAIVELETSSSSDVSALGSPEPDIQEAVRLVVAAEWAKDDWLVDGRRIPVDLRASTLASCDFFEANLQNAYLADACLGHARLGGAVLKHIVLARANLKAADLHGADLYGANLRRADLRRANLTDACLDYARLDRASLKYADLQGASLADATLVEALCHDADFQYANLRNASLQGADLRRANLDHAELLGARYNSATQFPVDFGDPAARGLIRSTPTNTADDSQCQAAADS